MKSAAAGMIGLGLATGLAACATAPVPETAPGPRIALSADDFATTIARLDAAVGSRPLKVFAVIDHAAGAASVDRELPPSRLLVFGNPGAGTPFMQANPAFGHELPLRILVYVEDGQTKLAYPDIAALARAYTIPPDGAPVDAVAATLEEIVNETAGR